MSECSVQTLKWGATWPSREQFHELADQGYRVIPIVRRLLAESLTPVGFYERLAGGRSGTECPPTVMLSKWHMPR